MITLIVIRSWSKVGFYIAALLLFSFCLSIQKSVEYYANSNVELFLLALILVPKKSNCTKSCNMATQPSNPKYSKIKVGKNFTTVPYSNQHNFTTIQMPKTRTQTKKILITNFLSAAFSIQLPVIFILVVQLYTCLHELIQFSALRIIWQNFWPYLC